MAAKVAIRFRPQAYRSTTEAVTIPGTAGMPIPDTDPVEYYPDTPGSRVETIQLVVFDDTKIGAGNPYVPGAPATEQHIRVVDEKAITKGYAEFEGKTLAQSKAVWDAILQGEKAIWLANPDYQAMVNAAIGAALSDYIIIS